MRPEVARASIAQRLVRAHLVVPADPGTQLAPGVLEADEVVLPDTFLLHAAEEPLDDPVLLRRVGGDELLGEPVIPTRRQGPSHVEKTSRHPRSRHPSVRQEDPGVWPTSSNII